MSAMLILWEKSNETVVSIFRRNVAKHPNKAAFLLDDKKLTFQNVNSTSIHFEKLKFDKFHFRSKT